MGKDTSKRYNALSRQQVVTTVTKTDADAVETSGEAAYNSNDGSNALVIKKEKVDFPQKPNHN